MKNNSSKLAGIALTATAVAFAALGGAYAPPAWSQVAVAVSVTLAPPPLPVYDQPPVPGDDFIWTPGYWAWNPNDGAYYWVPGTWVLAPEPGELWTPGYWAYERNGYIWYPGYWGRQVGFYGGLNYGFGYFGSGYQGGRWDRGVFRYNRAVTNVNTRVVHNNHVYNTVVSNPRRNDHVSFNGGRGGATARPSNEQRRFQATGHPGPNAEQMQHERAAMTAPTQRANGPHGMPQVAATPKPSGFAEPGFQHMRSERGQAQQAAHPNRPAQQAPQAAPPVRAEPPPRQQQAEHRAEPPPHQQPQPRPEPQRPQAAPHAEPPRQQPAARPEPPQRQEARPQEPRREEPRREQPRKEDQRKEDRKEH